MPIYDIAGSLYRNEIPEPELKNPNLKINLCYGRKHRDIKAIIHDGQVYLNAKDVCYNLQVSACKTPYISLSVINFVRTFISNLIV
jgi:hypothetical protein